MTAIEWTGAALAVFIAATCYDFAFARYAAAVAARRATIAAGWSAATYGIGLVGLSAVLQGSLWLAIPEAAGLFLGTLLGVRCRR